MAAAGGWRPDMRGWSSPPGPPPFRCSVSGGWRPDALLALTPLPPFVQGREERMSADGRYGVGMRWLAPAPSPSPASLESLR